MTHVEYTAGGAELLRSVRPLWEKLNAYHAKLSDVFRASVLKRTFEIRSQKLMEKASLGDMLVIKAEDRSTGASVGYCICTVDDSGMGEVDSIFVEDAYRGRGIGDELMRRGLAWAEYKGAETKRLSVAWCNRQTLPFYARYGFHPRTVVLEQTKTEAGGSFREKPPELLSGLDNRKAPGEHT